LRADLAELQRIADENGGTRASCTPGYEASVEYVVSQLRKAGYQPHLQKFRYTDVRELEQPRLEQTAPEAKSYAYGDEFVSLRYSGSGDVEARVQPVDVRSQTNGCESSDFDGFERASVALIRRGGCFFFVKVGFAVSAGASAVIVFNDGSPGHEDRSRRRFSTQSRFRPFRSRARRERSWPARPTRETSRFTSTRARKR
jgi:hypothetical protein